VVSGWVGEGYLDEMSTLGATTIAEYYQDRGFNTSVLDPVHFRFLPGNIESLRGGDRKENAATLRLILSGQERGPKRDAVLLNSGAALFVGGKVKSLTQGMEYAAELIDGGKAGQKLDELVRYRP